MQVKTAIFAKKAHLNKIPIIMTEADITRMIIYYPPPPPPTPLTYFFWTAVKDNYKTAYFLLKTQRKECSL